MAAKRDAAPIGKGESVVADPFDEECASEEFAALWRLGPEHVRRRWRTLLGRAMPSGLGRELTLRILAYHEQVRRLGDLDKVSQRVLSEMIAGEQSGKVTVIPRGLTSAPIASDGTQADAVKPVRAPNLLRPGTMLSREHGGVLHRVLVGADGFAWQGQSYDSLSKVALAITGTRWNGPRFFGLRDRPVQTQNGKREGRFTADASTATVKATVGRGRASGAMRSSSQVAAS